MGLGLELGGGGSAFDGRVACQFCCSSASPEHCALPATAALGRAPGDIPQPSQGKTQHINHAFLSVLGKATASIFRAVPVLNTGFRVWGWGGSQQRGPFGNVVCEVGVGVSWDALVLHLLPLRYEEDQALETGQL